MAKLQKNAYHSFVKTQSSVAMEHTVLRNTYFLLGLTLITSALGALFGMAYGQVMNPLLALLCTWGLLFAVQATANSAMGLGLTFLFTLFMGYSLGPILNLVVHHFANGTSLILAALSTTGIIFLSLSAYVLTTRENFSYMGGTLIMLLVGGIVLSLFAVLFQMPFLMLAVNALMVLVFSGLIMFHTSQIIHGGQTNYILATISLYLALYNLFVSLLQIFMMFSGGNNSRD